MLKRGSYLKALKTEGNHLTCSYGKFYTPNSVPLLQQLNHYCVHLLLQPCISQWNDTATPDKFKNKFSSLLEKTVFVLFTSSTISIK